MIDPTRGQPKYRQLRDILAQRIRGGVYPAGTMLPPERKLEELFSVSRVIVRKALAELYRKGYLERSPGNRAVVKQAGTAAEACLEMAFVSRGDYGVLDMHRLLYEALTLECHQREIRLSYVDMRHPTPEFLLKSEFAAVFITYEPGDGRRLAPLLRPMTRLIAVDDVLLDEGGSTVATDNLQCGALAAELLLEHGCKKPLFVGARHSYSYHPFAERKNGFVNALAKAGVVCGLLDVGLTAGRFHLDELCERLRANDCDGVFAYHDSLALATMDVLLGLGRKIPGEVALVGMDGLASGACAHPPLTSVAQPVEAIAKTALDEALAPEFHPRRLLLPGHLVKRESA